MSEAKSDEAGPTISGMAATGRISFMLGSEPALECRSDGKILVQGREAATDLEVVDALRAFLEATGHIRDGKVSRCEHCGHVLKQDAAAE